LYKVVKGVVLAIAESCRPSDKRGWRSLGQMNNPKSFIDKLVFKLLTARRGTRKKVDNVALFKTSSTITEIRVMRGLVEIRIINLIHTSH